MRRGSWHYVPLILLLLFLGVVPVFAQLVERVIDGDTLVVSGVGTVRLIGVDAPETVDPRKLAQYFGKEAAIFLRKLTSGRSVRLEYDVERTDRYGRRLAYVYLPDGTLINAELIRQGYAHAYTRFPFKYLDDFRTLEREARGADRGLWAGGAALVAPIFSPPAPSADLTETVYVTRTGQQYHRAGCRHLARSQIPMPLKEAATRYHPCEVCRPPVIKAP